MGFDLTDAAAKTEEFAVQRDWEQFHTLKNLSMTLTGEVGELVEIIQWMSDSEIIELLKSTAGRQRIEEEVADITIYALRIAQMTGIDLSGAIERKIALNEVKYPVETAKGSSAKYTELEEES